MKKFFNKIFFQKFHMFMSRTDLRLRSEEIIPYVGVQTNILVKPNTC